MKFMIAVATVLAVSSAQFQGFKSYKQPAAAPRPNAAKPLAQSENSEILRYDNDISPDGSFNYAYETSNGISAQAQGVPRDFGGNPPVVPVVSSGSFSWVSPEGESVYISYLADENGYQPEGSALPTPPPIPAQIARALDYVSKYNQKK